jgi:hypothetical protein
MTTYQFEIDEEEWIEWKRTVPRDKALHTRLRELMQADVEGRVRDPSEGRGPAHDEPGRPEDHARYEPEGDVVDRVVEEGAENWDDRHSRLQARKAAARAVLNELRTVGPMSKSEIVGGIQPEYPVEGQSENTWWRKNIAEDGPLKRVAEYDAGTQKWRWVGLNEKE